MNWLRSKTFWLVVIAALALGSALALLDGKNAPVRGIFAYSTLLALMTAALYGVWRATGSDIHSGKAALTAFLIRLVVGIGLMCWLPVGGYQDNPVSLAGYFYNDAQYRDGQAWELASSDWPLSRAFAGEYPSDQYGGTLALSAAVYRFLSPDVHRPWLILVLTAAAGALGVLCLWKAVENWFGRPVAAGAGWLFVLYPEGVLLGSTHMREAFVIPIIAAAFYGLVGTRRQGLPGEAAELGGREARAEGRGPKGKSQGGKNYRAWSGIAWLGGAGIALFVFSPPYALFTFIMLAGLWLVAPDRKLSWKHLLALGGILIVGVLIVSSLWASLPSLQGRDPRTILFTWLQSNANFQSQAVERGSGQVQNLIHMVGERWGWIVLLVYGVAQPVLPAAVADPAPLLWRTVGIWRAAGWYALAPLLIYGMLAVLVQAFQDHPSGIARPNNAALALTKRRRAQLIWIGLMIWTWILISAYNAGGDQWDNPRYRAVLLVFQVLLAAWVWDWVRQRRDSWLKRWLWVEAVFLGSFSVWYISRYWLVAGALKELLHINIGGMIVFNLVAAALILGGGWLMDRRKPLRDG